MKRVYSDENFVPPTKEDYEEYVLKRQEEIRAAEHSNRIRAERSLQWMMENAGDKELQKGNPYDNIRDINYHISSYRQYVASEKKRYEDRSLRPIRKMIADRKREIDRIKRHCHEYGQDNAIPLLDIIATDTVIIRKGDFIHEMYVGEMLDSVGEWIDRFNDEMKDAGFSEVRLPAVLRVFPWVLMVIAFAFIILGSVSHGENVTTEQFSVIGLTVSIIAAIVIWIIRSAYRKKKRKPVIANATSAWFNEMKAYYEKHPTKPL